MDQNVGNFVHVNGSWQATIYLRNAWESGEMQMQNRIDDQMIADELAECLLRHNPGGAGAAMYGAFSQYRDPYWTIFIRAKDANLDLHSDRWIDLIGERHPEVFEEGTHSQEAAEQLRTTWDAWLYAAERL